MKAPNLTEGPIFKTLCIYSLPIIFTNLVQLLFHAADTAVLALMASGEAVAAVGACGSIITLLCLTYFVTTGMEVFSFSLRSIGHQISTMVVGAICGLGLRVSWATFVWPLHPTLPMLFACYAISAGVAIVIYLIVYLRGIKKLEETHGAAAQ